jgi:hypothetical protein
LLQEQQTLQRLQTEWLLQLLKTKQRLDKTGTDTAKQEAAVCAKLLESARELPSLYETATMRLKDASLTNLPATEHTLKATKRLAEELRRASSVLQQAPANAFKVERAADEASSQFWIAVWEASARNPAVELLDAIERTRDPKAVRDLREFVKRQAKVCEQLAEFYSASQDKAKAAHFKKLLAKGGLLDRIETSLALIEVPPPVPPPVPPAPEPPASAQTDAIAQLRKDLQAGFGAADNTADRLIVVVGLRQLADRQQRLHERLQKQRDEVLSQLLGEIE